MIPATFEEFVQKLVARASFLKSHKVPRAYTKRKALEDEEPATAKGDTDSVEDEAEAPAEEEAEPSDI